MKTNKNVLLLVLFVGFISNSLFSQSKTNENKFLKAGIGIDLEFPDYNWYPVPPTKVILVFDLFNHLRIEPGLGMDYNKDYDNNLNVSDVKEWTLSLGTYWLINWKNTSTYIGINYNHTNTNTENKYTAPTTNIFKQNQLGPAIGLEYSFGGKFSIGGEIILNYYQSKSHFTSQNVDTEGSTKRWHTSNKIKLRFFI